MTLPDQDFSAIDFTDALNRKRAESRVITSRRDGIDFRIPAYDKTVAAFREQAQKTATGIVSDRRDGIIPLADKVVLACLRALQVIPEDQRQGADDLIDGIAEVYCKTSSNEREAVRRATALWRISLEVLK